MKPVTSESESGTQPEIKVLHKGKTFRTVLISFKKGQLLKPHKAGMPSKLTVISGQIIYREGEMIKTLSAENQTDIPVDVLHSVEPKADSLCVLTQGE